MIIEHISEGNETVRITKGVLPNKYKFITVEVLIGNEVMEDDRFFDGERLCLTSFLKLNIPLITDEKIDELINKLKEHVSL